MSDVNLRRVALDVLDAVWNDGAYLTPTLALAFEKHEEIDKRGRAFLTRLCFGTEEKLLFLDGVIDCYSSVPVKKLRPAMLGILRLSAYQVYYMDGVPEHAIVNEAVGLAKKRGLMKLSGFTNGVLRAMVRDGRDPEEALQLIYEKKDGLSETEKMSLFYSIPVWIIKLWDESYGREVCEKICSGFLKPSPTTCWVKDVGRDYDEKVFKLVDKSFGVYELISPGNMERLPEYKNGNFYVQDIASMQTVILAGIREGDRVIDVCASPGGKSLLAARLGAKVLARAISDEKTGRILENIRRMKEEKVTVEKWDATVDDPESHGKYDVVIADLPCSGLGVLANKPEIRYRVKPEDISELAALQEEMLDTVCAYVRPGGRLVFSTCTVTKAENDDNVKRFLDTHRDFLISDKRQLLPEAGLHDGFFVAIMERSVTEAMP